MKKTTRDKLEKKVAAISDLIVSDESAQKLTEPLSKLVTAIASDEKNAVELKKNEVDKQKIESEERLEKERIKSQERIEQMKIEAQKDASNKEFASKVFNVTLDCTKCIIGAKIGFDGITALMDYETTGKGILPFRHSVPILIKLMTKQI